MTAFELIFGIVLLAAAVVALIVAFDMGSIVPVGFVVVALAGGVILVVHAAHRINVRFHEKHLAILHDLHRQGFQVPYDNVFARGGNYLPGTEADFAEGQCQWAFATTNINGVWRVTLPRKDGNGVVVFTPARVASLAAACPK